jgi:quinol monooxygenase YgiN
MSASVEIGAAETQSAEWFAITVAFTVRPERRDHFFKLVRTNAANSLEKEAGCLRFDVLAPLQRGGPDVFLYEIYTDRAAFDAHLASAHFQTFDAATRDMVIAKTISEFRVEAPLTG